MSLVVSLVLGVCSVMQAGLNRKVALKFDLSTATFFSSAVLFIFSILLFFSTPRKSNSLALFSKLEFWQVLPGVLGIVLVAGIPWAISKWGATSVFVGLVTSQVLAGLIWDGAFEKRAPGMTEVSGVLLSLVGFVIVSRGNG